MSEETIYDSSEVIEDRPNTEFMDNREMDQSQYSDPETVSKQNTVDEQPQDTISDAPQEKKKKAGGGVAAAAGVAGLAGAALGVLSPKFVFPDEPEPGPDPDPNPVEPEPEPEPQPEPQPSPDIQGHDLDVATSVNDDMSYNEAFAAARHEVGPGGVFVWHGHTYGTYYGSEWNAMSAEEHDQYWADVNHTSSHIDYDAPDPQPDPNDPVVLEVHENDVYAVYDVDGDGVADAAVVDANGNATLDVIMDTNGDGHFDTLLVDPDENFDGEVVEIAGVDLIPDDENVLLLNENDVYAAVDVNDDGILDSVIVDANGNETLDLVVDTDGDGVVDTLVLDPVSDNNDIYYAEDNRYDIDGVVLTPDDGLNDDYLASNVDIDDGSSVPFDADITIDNDMDMDDFV